MLALRVLVAVLAFGAVIATEVPTAVVDGYYPSRSGNVVLSASAALDASVAFVDSSSSYLSSQPSGSLPAARVAEITTRAMGIPTPSSESTSFVRNDLFNRPHATVLLAIESLGSSLVSSQQLPALSALTATPLETSLPASSVALAATLATGTAPASHGIVAPAWQQNGKHVRAYDSADSQSARATVADILAQTFNGESLLVSCSGNLQHALAHSVNPALSAANPSWASHTACLTEQDGSFTSAAAPTAASTALSASAATLLAALARSQLWSASRAGVSVDLTHVVPRSTVSVTYTSPSDGAVTTTFDLTVPEQAKLFIELAHAESTAARLTAEPALNALVHDDAPDHIAFTFTGLTSLVEKYGRSSPQFRAALRVVDAAVPALLQSLSGVYGGRTLSSVVLMGSHPSILTTTDSRAVLSQLNRFLPNQDVRYYPSLYVDASRASDVCKVLSVSLDGTMAYCPRDALVGGIFFSLQENEATALGATATNTTTTTTVERYQITLWISVLLVFFAAYSVYSLAFMSFKRDTLLYSGFNPDWADRKRR